MHRRINAQDRSVLSLVQQRNDLSTKLDAQRHKLNEIRSQLIQIQSNIVVRHEENQQLTRNLKLLTSQFRDQQQQGFSASQQTQYKGLVEELSDSKVKLAVLNELIVVSTSHTKCVMVCIITKAF